MSFDCYFVTTTKSKIQIIELFSVTQLGIAKVRLGHHQDPNRSVQTPAAMNHSMALVRYGNGNDNATITNFAATSQSIYFDLIQNSVASQHDSTAEQFAIVPVRARPIANYRPKIRFVVVQIGSQKITFNARDVLRSVFGDQSNHINVHFDGYTLKFSIKYLMRLLMSGLFRVYRIDDITIGIKIPDDFFAFEYDEDDVRGGVSGGYDALNNETTTGAFSIHEDEQVESTELTNECAVGDNSPSTSGAKNDIGSNESPGKKKTSHKPSEVALQHVKKQLHF